MLRALAPLALLGAVAASPATLQIGSCTISEVDGRLQSSCPIDYVQAPPAAPPPAPPVTPTSYSLLGDGCCFYTNSSNDQGRLDRVRYSSDSNAACAQRCTGAGLLCVAYTHRPDDGSCFLDMIDGAVAGGTAAFPGNAGIYDNTDGYTTDGISASTHDSCANGWSCYLKS